VELRSLQRQLPQMTALGASLVAVSPQVPDQSLTTSEKMNLKFPVLSDVGNGVARRFGLVFALSEHLRSIYASLGADLPKFNGTETFELPVPATFVIDPGGLIRAAHVNADYKQRMEPARILEALGELKT
jgi:peroxiredoxin